MPATRTKLAPPTLVEDPALSYRGAGGMTDHDRFENVLVQGDNLLALQALAQEYAGTVQCVYIDPPYNTGSAFRHYDDGVEHSLWLSRMRARLELLRALLSERGSIWISIDDHECHYVRALCDDVFGRANHIATLVAIMNPKGRQLGRHFANVHEYVLCYAKDSARCEIVAESEDGVNPRDFPLRDEQGPYRLLPLRNTNKRFNPDTRPNLHYPVHYDPSSGRISLDPAPGCVAIWPRFGDGKPAVWRWGKDKLARQVSDLRVRRLFRAAAGGEVHDLYQRDGLEPGRTKKIQSVWLPAEIGTSDEAKREGKLFAPDDVFGTPKPERLLRRVIEAASRPGDLVLDAFAGSGTTGAVAHKMGRRWIMIELGDHAVSHIVPRLRRVIDGEDTGGVSEATGWTGGGGFRFLRLA
jgi:adenine-specific DNA-methyltransferase